MGGEIIAQVKNAFCIAFTFLLGHITQVEFALWTLLFGFTVNVFMGFWADVSSSDGKQKKRFKLKKATEGIKLLMFYFIIVFFLYAITHREPELSDTVVSWLTYIVSYFYLTNIFRNAKTVFPKSKAVKFIYEFISTEVFIKLKEYIGWKHDKKVVEEEVKDDEE